MSARTKTKPATGKFLAVLAAVSTLSANAAAKPNAALMKRIEAGVEIIGIVHWGLNTYTDREWGFGDERPEWLDPDDSSADQIVGACRDGGLQGLAIVAKHHDGFCLWPTKTTAHNIAKSPFRDIRRNRHGAVDDRREGGEVTGPAVPGIDFP